MGSIKSLILHTNRICALFSGISIVILTGLAAGNMLMRIVYRPINGSYELIGFFGAVSVGLALGYTQLRKDHIVVTIISDNFNEKTKKNLDRVSYGVSTIFFLIAGWQTFKWGIKLAQMGELSETLKIIYYPFVYVLGVGFFVIGITLSLDFITTFERK
jgi:TRAP-type C4-dicarboxylate transport system permease small subunit